MKVWLAVAATLVSVLAAEAVARSVYTPTLDFHDLTPWTDQEFTPPLNPDGFREAPLRPQDLEPTTIRLLFLGDSFTFGSGIRDGRDRFSDLIEARLQAELVKQGRRAHIYNAGLPGSLPTQWVPVFEGLVTRYKPHLVVTVFFLRDGTSMGTSLRSFQAKIASFREAYASGPLYDVSYLVRMLCDLRLAAEFSSWHLEQFRNAYTGDEAERSVWLKMQGEIAKLRRISRRVGSPFHLVVFPMLFDLRNYPLHEIETEIQAFAGQREIPMFSLTPSFLGRDETELWVSANDQHPNERGHAIAAEALYPYIVTALREVGVKIASPLGPSGR